jgi:hypothetical protein
VVPNSSQIEDKHGELERRIDESKRCLWKEGCLAMQSVSKQEQHTVKEGVAPVSEMIHPSPYSKNKKKGNAEWNSPDFGGSEKRNMRDEKQEGSLSRIAFIRRGTIPSAKAPRAWFETVPSILHFPSLRKKATSDPSDKHPVMLASANICLSCSNMSGVLMLHEEEKRHAWSGVTRSSSFTMGNVRAGERGRFYVRQCDLLLNPSWQPYASELY